MGKLLMFSGPSPASTKKTKAVPKQNSVPIVIGCKLDTKEDSISLEAQFIQVSPKLVIDPRTPEHLEIGKTFFFTRNEALEFLAQQYETTAAQANSIATDIRKEIQRVKK